MEICSNGARGKLTTRVKLDMRVQNQQADEGGDWRLHSLISSMGGFSRGLDFSLEGFHC